ncbi:uncharacterized protein KNAG_0A06925 [Huiozyma naganishii CBS 8797]|uniref:Uncharacterized protein n=1 Tax=Huiozyma naganishii (strain ATCC MYA-139 / BCRC 22969 / CBS 8797 / KCTC 17520 / NBRC 10181 / NCYC 3082 / Yp74L-3) TaxID=1071383 RepID=J7R0L1_HUIN7|nr:hypothetical protein KNAG_0A06925 [Kazachstania naganishii CBS 8797]CCK68345.1 hypothetical protein KNAG_0A06925 [Kazachstania naganishii CBS 8797]
MFQKVVQEYRQGKEAAKKMVAVPENTAKAPEQTVTAPKQTVVTAAPAAPATTAESPITIANTRLTYLRKNFTFSGAEDNGMQFRQWKATFKSIAEGPAKVLSLSPYMIALNSFQGMAVKTFEQFIDNKTDAEREALTVEEIIQGMAAPYDHKVDKVRRTGDMLLTPIRSWKACKKFLKSMRPSSKRSCLRGWRETFSSL